jgi:hypothetical protein
MYEEDDDDLPLQYRRLTAHLQTNSADFNRRLAAYLTNQVAMRQMVNYSYIQQYPNAAQFASHPQRGLYNSPMTVQGLPPTPTASYRSAPYPSPYQAGFRQIHNRAYSMAAPNEISAAVNAAKSPSTASESLAQRRMSTPATVPSPELSGSLNTDGVKNDLDYQRQVQSATTAESAQHSSNLPPLWQDTGPFTTCLPPESQQLLGPALDPNDPMTSVLMAGSEPYLSSPYYPWGNAQMSYKGGPAMPSIHPLYNRMSATLAPGALDSGTDALSAIATMAAPSNDNTSAPSAGPDLNLSQESNAKGIQGYLGLGLTRDNSMHSLGSGQVTPGEGFWDSFVQDGGWNEDTSAS